MRKNSWWYPAVQAARLKPCNHRASEKSRPGTLQRPSRGEGFKPTNRERSLALEVIVEPGKSNPALHFTLAISEFTLLQFLPK